MNATILDLRRNMPDVIAALNRNERVNLTYRGRKKAVIIPAETATSISASSHPAFGMWSDREDLQDVNKLVRTLRKGRTF